MRILLPILFFLLCQGSLAADPVIRIGSKNFTEGYILAEILAQKIEAAGVAKVERRFGLGGTGILFEALRSDEIDVYPEYTGTIATAILKSEKRFAIDELNEQLDEFQLLTTKSLGFNNSYGLAMKRSLSEKLGIHTISDLKNHPDLRMAFSYEFMQRPDGFPALTSYYGFQPLKPLRMDHALVYTSIAEGKTDVIEVYTTDSKIKKYDLVVLRDDLNFFPRYEGVFLVRKSVLKKIPQLQEVFDSLAGQLTDQNMLELNGLVELSNQSFKTAAQVFTAPNSEVEEESYSAILVRQTKRHLLLVLLPTLLSILIGLPLGVLATRVRWVGQVVLMTTGLIQTIPSLALLCFLIPVFGIGLVPSMVALVLYGLLPIVRNTYSGLMAIDNRHHEVAKVLGLSWRTKLFRIEFPMAAIHILGGIKTAAIINVGMATLAAFIGAGGYGALIVTGLALNDNGIILQGALPAAGMAIAVHFFFEILDRWLTPRGLR